MQRPYFKSFTIRCKQIDLQIQSGLKKVFVQCQKQYSLKFIIFDFRVSLPRYSFSNNTLVTYFDFYPHNPNMDKNNYNFTDYVEPEHSANEISLFRRANQSQFKEHFRIRRVYMPRKESFDQYCTRLLRWLGLNNKICYMQLCHVHSSETVDISLGFRFDQDAIQIYSKNVNFRLHDSSNNLVLIKPEISQFFRLFGLQGAPEPATSPTFIPPMTVENLPSQNQLPSQQPEGQILENEQSVSQSIIDQEPGQIITSSSSSSSSYSQSSSSSVSSESKSRSRSRSKRRYQPKIKKVYDRYRRRSRSKQGMHPSTLLNKKGYQNRFRPNLHINFHPYATAPQKSSISPVLLLGIPRQFDYIHVSKYLKKHPRREFIIKSFSPKEEEGISYVEIELQNQQLSHTLLEDALEVEGLPVLMLQRQPGRPLRSILCQYQVRVLLAEGSDIFSVFKHFRSYGRIVYIEDTSAALGERNGLANLIITYNKKYTVEKVILKEQGVDFRVLRVQMEQCCLLAHLSVRDPFYGLVRREKKQYLTNRTNVNK